jgi:hypothetical protein
MFGTAARAAIAVAAERGRDARTYLRDARRLVRKLRRVRGRCARAWTLQLGGAIAYLEGRHDEAISKLRAACDAFEALDMQGHLAVTEIRLAQLVQDAQSRGVIERALERLTDQRVVRPTAIADTLLPGFPPLDGHSRVAP